MASQSHVYMVSAEAGPSFSGGGNDLAAYQTQFMGKLFKLACAPWPARHRHSYTCGLRARLNLSPVSFGLRASHMYHLACAPVTFIIHGLRACLSSNFGLRASHLYHLACAPVAFIAYIVYGLRAYLLRTFGLRASHLYHLVCAPII